MLYDEAFRICLMGCMDIISGIDTLRYKCKNSNKLNWCSIDRVNPVQPPLLLVVAITQTTIEILSLSQMKHKNYVCISIYYKPILI